MVNPPQPAADPATAFLALARSAIAPADTLATVRSLHMVFTFAEVTSADMPIGIDSEMGHGSRRTSVQFWLAPPSSFLRETVGFESGCTIGPPRAVAQQRNNFRLWTLALLLYDPGSLGVALTDEGAAVLDGKRVHALHATAPDGFDLRLYFETESHRLLMTSSFTWQSIEGRLVRTPEQRTYGAYRSVAGLELPFRITRVVAGLNARVPFTTQTFDVERFEVNPRNLDQQFAHAIDSWQPARFPAGPESTEPACRDTKPLQEHQ